LPVALTDCERIYETWQRPGKHDCSRKSVRNMQRSEEVRQLRNVRETLTHLPDIAEMAVSVAALGAEEERHIASLFAAIDSAEKAIISAIGRECEALRSGRPLAAMALHISLCDAARAYIAAAKSARACLGLLNRCAPDAVEWLEERRKAFNAVLKIELSALAAIRANMDTAPRNHAFGTAA
jgi:hypothetical protein